MAELANAWISIIPDTHKIAKEIKKALNDVTKLGDSAGEKLGAEMADAATDALDKGLSAGDVIGALDDEMSKAGLALGDQLGDTLSDGFEASVSGLKKSALFGAVAGAVSAVTSSAIGAIRGLASEAISASDATDKFRQTMNFAGMDTKVIDEMTVKTREYADVTVYELADIQSMVAQLAANGVQDYANLAEAAGNLNAVAGGNADTFASVGMVMTQTAGAGKLTTENWNQLSDAIPGASGKIQDALREADAFTGNFRDALAKGEVTAEEFNAAVLKIGSEPIAVEAARSTETFEGMLGNLQAAVTGGLADALNELKPQIGAFVDGATVVVEGLVPRFVSVVQTITEAASGAVEFFKQNQGWIAPLAVTVGVLAAGYELLAFQQTVVAAGGIVSFLKGLTVVTNLQTAAQTALNVVTNANPLAKLAVVVAAVVAGLVYFFTQTETGRAVWQAFTNVLIATWTAVSAALAAGFEWVKGVFSGFVEFMQAGWQAFTGSVSSSWGAVSTYFAAGFETVKGVFLGVVEFIQARWQELSSVWTAFSTLITTAFSTAWEIVKDIFATAWLVLVDLVTGNWQQIGETLQAGWAAIKNHFQEGIAAVKNAFSAFWGAVKNIVRTAWESVKSVVKAGWDAVKNIFTSAIDAVKQSVQQWISALFARFEMMKRTVVQTVTDMASNLIARFVEMKNKVVAAVQDLPQKIKGFFQNAGSWLVDAGKKLLQGLKDGLLSKWNDLQAWLGSLKDKVVGVFSGATASATSQINASRRNLPAGHSRGGLLPTTGPGTNRTDGILGVTGTGMPIARVDAGEFIVNAQATQRYLPLLWAINQGRLNPSSVSGFASGGVVGGGFDPALLGRASRVDQVKGALSITGADALFGDLVSGVASLRDAAEEYTAAVNAVNVAERKLAAARASGDVEAAKSAQEELNAALETVGATASAAGRAQLAAIMAVLKTVVKLGKWASKLAVQVFKTRAVAAAAIGEHFAALRTQAGMVADLRASLVGLSAEFVKAQIDMAAAARKRRITEISGQVAVGEALAKVSAAQRKFDAQRQADAKLQLSLYTDLSLGIDRFRWGMKDSLGQAMGDMAAWSDESHALYSELLAAQTDVQLAQLGASKESLDATYRQAQASAHLVEVTSKLQYASEQLRIMAQNNFGLDQTGATVGQRYAKLAEELAEIQAKKASASTWLNPANWFNGYYKNANRRQGQIRAEMAELEKRKEFQQIGFNAGDVNSLVRQAGFSGFFDAGAHVKELIQNSVLGDAARALDRAAFEKSLLDIQKQKEDLERQSTRGFAELEYLRKSDDFQARIDALLLERKSHESAARAWREQDEATRREYMQISAIQSDGARSLRSGSTVVQIPAEKTAFSYEEVTGLVRHFGGEIQATNQRVERLEVPPVQGRTVALQRRG